MQTADFYSSATGTLRVNGGRDKNAPQGVSLSIDDLSYIKQGSRVNENSDSFAPTQAQLDAMNSGITSEGVEQITTNKNNISSLLLSDTSKIGDLNDVTVNEFALYTPQSTHLPTQSFYYVRTTTDSSANSRIQEAFEMISGEAYVRTYSFNMWNTWLKITNPTT